MDQTSTDLAFFALSDPTRRRIIEILAEVPELRVVDLAGELDVTRQAVAKHLEILSEAGLTRTNRRGRERFTSLHDQAFDPVRDWLERYDRFWDDRLKALKRAIEGRKKS